MFDQFAIPSFHFQLHDLAVIGFLTFLEGILSIDNALVLAILAKHLPPEKQKKALTYGLIGAVFSRFFSILLANYLIHIRWIKFLGGGYLLWLALKNLVLSSGQSEETFGKKRGFWTTIFVIEMTDIAFAVDSILAAVSLTNKFWLIFLGGFLGVILIRFAASLFIKLLEKFPRFEKIAYILVGIVGLKVVIEGFDFQIINFHSSTNPAFWVFWISMLFCIGLGFFPSKNEK